MTEARDRELKRRELRQTALPLREVFKHWTQRQTEDVRGGIGRDEHPAVLRPQERQLPRTVTRSVDRLKAASDWQCMRILGFGLVAFEPHDDDERQLHAGFLERLAAFYAILADQRNCLGVTPTRRLK